MNTSPPPCDYPPSPPVRYVLPKGAYTPWITRVAATLIDSVPFVVILGVGWAAGEVSLDCGVVREGQQLPGYCGWAITDAGDFSSTGSVLLTAAAIFSLATYVLAPAYWLWSLGYRQGKTGSSLGKSVCKFKVVSDRTWQPIGVGPSIMRQFAHFIDYAACYVGYLWPLWDGQRRTIADIVMSTVCVPLNPPTPSAP